MIMSKKEVLEKLLNTFTIKELRLAQAVMDQIWYEKHKEITDEWK